MAEEMVLRGFFPPVAGLRDRMRLCHPVLSRRPNDADLFLADRLHWQLDGEGLTPVDDDELCAFGTSWPDDSLLIGPGVGVAVIGDGFMAEIATAMPSSKAVSGFRRVDGMECWVRLTPRTDFEEVGRQLADLARDVFDRALRRAVNVQQKLSQEGSAALRVLRGAPGRRNSDVVMRELAAAHVQGSTDLYRRLLIIQSRRLGEEEGTLAERAMRYVDSMRFLIFLGGRSASTRPFSRRLKLQDVETDLHRHRLATKRAFAARASSSLIPMTKGSAPENPDFHFKLHAKERIYGG